MNAFILYTYLRALVLLAVNYNLLIIEDDLMSYRLYFFLEILPAVPVLLHQGHKSLTLQNLAIFQHFISSFM
jgi:hypothetical protein